jgi:hypothetical protein
MYSTHYLDLIINDDGRVQEDDQDGFEFEMSERQLALHSKLFPALEAPKGELRILLEKYSLQHPSQEITQSELCLTLSFKLHRLNGLAAIPAEVIRERISAYVRDIGIVSFRHPLSKLVWMYRMPASLSKAA